MIAQFRALIESADSIAITSHYNPDPDAVGSSLALYSVLHRAYPDKHFVISFDGGVGEFANTFENVSVVKNQDFLITLQESHADLAIFTDASGYSRFSRDNPDALKNFIQNQHIVTVCIDHHETDGLSKFDWYYNHTSSSCSEDIAVVLQQNSYELTRDDYFVVLVGMISDTGRFLYPNNHPGQTIEILTVMFYQGLTIMQANAVLESITVADADILSLTLQHLEVRKGYNISWLSDSEVATMVLKAGSNEKFSKGMHGFINSYVRQIGSTNFGFVVYKSPDKQGFYKCSFRSDGSVDCNQVGGLLVGGGHIGAAACLVQAETLEEAKKLIIQVVEKYLQKD